MAQTQQEKKFPFAFNLVLQKNKKKNYKKIQNLENPKIYFWQIK